MEDDLILRRELLGDHESQPCEACGQITTRSDMRPVPGSAVGSPEIEQVFVCPTCYQQLTEGELVIEDAED